MKKEFYHKIEQASIDELRELQRQRLKWTLSHAYENSPMYNKKFKNHGVHPDDFKQLEDLDLFPFTTKEDLRVNYPFNTFAVPMDKVSRIHASSGTTGKPVVVGYTKNDIETWSDAVARSIYAAGGRAGEKVHIAYGYGLFTGGLGAHFGAEKLSLTVIPMSGGNTKRQVQLIEDFKPEIIMVTPSYILNIIDEYKAQGLDAKQSSLRVGILGAEPWTNSMRQAIELGFGIDATDIYGLSEVIGPGVGQECIETKDGPTLWEDLFYPEIIHRDQMHNVPDGTEGELVFTTLTKEAMPIIRYRTRDITSLQPGTSRTMRRMQKITGRSDDMMIIRGVNVFPSQIEEQILAIPGLSPHYLIEMVTQGNLEGLIIKVEPRLGIGEAEIASAVGRLADNIKDYIGISVKVLLSEPNSIPRSEGKAVRVIDNRLSR